MYGCRERERESQECDFHSRQTAHPPAKRINKLLARSRLFSTTSVNVLHVAWLVEKGKVSRRLDPLQGTLGLGW